MKPRFSLFIYLPLLILMTASSFAQSDENALVSTFKYFVGSWEGQGVGIFGISRVEKEYDLVLGGKFIRIRHRSIYEPQEKNPKGETYESWSFISYDANQKKFVNRQLDVEGFVNHYLLESISADGKKFVFVTEYIENYTPGSRARLTYTIINKNEFVERFEVAPPQKEYAFFVENTMKRLK